MSSVTYCYDVFPTPENYWGYMNPIGARSCCYEGKRFAEALFIAYHRKYGPDVRIARIFNSYGPRLRGVKGLMAGRGFAFYNPSLSESAVDRVW